MATFNEDDNRKRTSSEDTIKDIEDTLVSDDENLDEYGVWVKSGPDDVGESNFDEEFEISDLNSTMGEDLLTEEEENLLSDFEDRTVTDERLPDIELSDSDFPREPLSIDLPDLDDESFGSDDSHSPSLDDMGSLDFELPEEEPVSTPDNDLPSFEAEPSEKTYDEDLEASILNDLPEINVPADEDSILPIEDEIPVTDETPAPADDDISSMEDEAFSLDEDTPSIVESSPIADETSSVSSESFMEISLDSFGEAEDEDATELEENFFEQESTEVPSVEDDFLDLDFEEDGKDETGADDSLFTTEELDDFFGVPVEDADQQTEEKSEVGENTVPPEPIDITSFDSVGDDRNSSITEVPEDNDFSELNTLDEIITGFPDDSVPDESTTEDLIEEMSDDTIQDLAAGDISLTEETIPEPLFEETKDAGIPEVSEFGVVSEEPKTEIKSERTAADTESSKTGEIVLEDNLGNVEAEIKTAKSGTSIEASILVQIERELTSIRAELSGLKEELSSLRQKPVDASSAEDTASDSEKASGFFDEDEDETIALTGDELDNILNTADITEASGEEEITAESLVSPLVQDDSVFISRDDDVIPIEEKAFSGEFVDTTDSMDFEKIDESTASDSDEQSIEDGITLVEVPEEKKYENSFFDEKPETVTSSESVESRDPFRPVFEEIEEEASAGEPFEAISESEQDVFEESETTVFIPEESETEFASETISDSKNEKSDRASGENAMESGSDMETVPETSFQDSPSYEETSGQKNHQITENVPLQGSLRDEIKSVLSYMDTLLEALPEEKIEEFARSEHFDVYRKLFEELGLGK